MTSSFRIFVSMLVPVIGLWAITASVLFVLVSPYHFPNDQMPVLDSVALVEAASVIVVLAVFSWMPVLILAKRRYGPLLGFVAVALTWISLAVSFRLIDGSAFEQGCRACRVLSNGSDIVFMPLIIPVISAFSGGAFQLMRWLRIALEQSDRSSGEVMTE
jgi:hypothetical protein